LQGGAHDILPGMLCRSGMPPEEPARILQRSIKRSTLISIRECALLQIVPVSKLSSRLSPPPPPLVDSAQGSNALGFFLLAPSAVVPQ